MFPDNSCVDGTRVDVKLFAKDVAKTLRVEQRAGTYDVAGGQAKFFLDDVSEDVDGISGNDKNTVEALGHKLRNTGTHDDEVTGEHIETGALKLTRCANGDDNDGARCGVLVGPREDLYRRAEWDGLLEIQRLALNVVFGIADQNDLANQVVMQDGVGAGGPDVPTADDGDPGVRSRHDLPQF